MRKLLISFFLLFSLIANASEGLWIPLLLEQQIIPDMQAQGCKLSAEQIYSVEQACLKDAVVRIGRGCSGGFVSEDGLVMTNYHCVQYQISVACESGSNYIKDGFFARSKDEEIRTQRLSVELLEAMYDVTDVIKPLREAGVSLKEACDYVLKDSTKEYQFSVEAFYSDNQYFLFKTKKFTDVRLVAFMPADIAQFGADADNWKWPRASADFALIRVYDNNQPYHPKKTLEINADGVKKGDFTMVIGFPAETKMYGTAEELDMVTSLLNPAQIKMREIRLEPIKNYMKKGDNEYTECYALYSSLSNYYEKWQGENYGIENSDAKKYRAKRDEAISKWINSSDSLQKKYGDLVEQYNEYALLYYKTYTKLVVYLEGLWRMKTLLPSSIAVSSTNFDFLRGDKFLSVVKKYNPELEKDALLKMIQLATVYEEDETKALPIMRRVLFGKVTGATQKEIDNYLVAYQDSIFNKSVFTNYARAEQFQNMINKRKKYQDDGSVHNYLMKNDALYRLTNDVYRILNIELMPLYGSRKQAFDSVACLMNQAMLEYYNGKMFPDANNTMRVSYGKVKPFTSKPENTSASFYTTENDFLDKLQKNPRDFKADSLFITLLQNKEYGSFQKNEIVMNFTATNQTSGGNSGSPVVDAEGYLIGLNFDRNWEGTVSDFYYDESFCRNITVDIRYVLFCLEQYGKANNLIDELKIKK